MTLQRSSNQLFMVFRGNGDYPLVAERVDVVDGGALVVDGYIALAPGQWTTVEPRNTDDATLKLAQENAEHVRRLRLGLLK